MRTKQFFKIEFPGVLMRSMKEGEYMPQNNMNKPLTQDKPKHRMYCAKSGLSCLVYHYDGVCPDVRDCEACKLERLNK